MASHAFPIFPDRVPDSRPLKINSGVLGSQILRWGSGSDHIIGSGYSNLAGPSGLIGDGSADEMGGCPPFFTTNLSRTVRQLTS